MNPSRSAVLLALLLFPGLASAQEKSLHWAELAVRARLDAEGVLHVEERQVMVFTGDWNGGERRFDLRLGERLQLLRLSRIDPATGEAHPLFEGDLADVDEFSWVDDTTLRWRSRSPSDPPFQETAIPYVLEYTLSGILQKAGGLYRLSHDFAFPERAGVIERFTLDFALDPVWQPVAGVPAHLERRNLVPGESVIVTADLAYHGASEDRLAGIRAATPAPLRAAFFAASLLAMAWLYVSFRRREAGLGRYSPPPVPREWDEAWLRDHVFLYLPEEVGALWDRKVGPAEVAATLARLVAEGKLASEVRPRRSFFGKDVLHLTLKVDRGAFTGYERRLLDKLFFSGSTETDTETVRERYKASGFDPVALIKEDLEKKLRTHAELKGTTRPGGGRRTALLFLATLVLFGLDCLGVWEQSLVLALIVLFAVTWLYVPGLLAAFAWRKRTERLDAAALGFLLPGLAIFAVSILATFFGDWFAVRVIARPGLFGDLALALLPVAAWSSLLNNARTRESGPAIQRRQILGAARRLLRRELGSREPRLRDEWLPYLLAFGLQRDVDRWFRAFGGAGSTSSFSSSSSSSSFGSGGGGWTGGGGAFGGAGSSASWAAAATGLAAGVAAPSSSGGGGGGGGGGSSGGGGGGGW
jgi:uncharacterized membrane protein YgcG